MSCTTEFLTTGEAARILAVSTMTVQRWVRSGRLEGHRVGHFTVVLRQDVEAIGDELKGGQ